MELGPTRAVPGLLLREVGDEVVVYDPATAQAHALNATAALVLGACDGKSSLAEVTRRLAERTGLPPDAQLVEMTLCDLKAAGLVSIDAPLRTIDRRALIKRLGVGATFLAALPLIETIAAPTVAAAASAGGGGGGGGGGLVLSTPGITVVGLLSTDFTSYVDQPMPAVDLPLLAVFSDGSRWDVTQLAAWFISGPGGSTISNAAPTKGEVTYGLGHNLVRATYRGLTKRWDVWGLPTGSPGPGNVERIEVRPNSLTGFAFNASPFQFSAFAYTSDPDFGSGPLDVSADPGTVWVTDNPSVATVDGSGLVTAVGPGIATIAASYGGKSASATWIIKSNLWIWVLSSNGQTSAQAVAGVYSGTTETDVTFDPGTTWISDNPSVATVSPGGMITVVGGSGTANITATYGSDTSNTLSFTV